MCVPPCTAAAPRDHVEREPGVEIAMVERVALNRPSGDERDDDRAGHDPPRAPAGAAASRHQIPRDRAADDGERGERSEYARGCGPRGYPLVVACRRIDHDERDEHDGRHPAPPRRAVRDREREERDRGEQRRRCVADVELEGEEVGRVRREDVRDQPANAASPATAGARLTGRSVNSAAPSNRTTGHARRARPRTGPEDARPDLAVEEIARTASGAAADGGQRERSEMERVKGTGLCATITLRTNQKLPVSATATHHPIATTK
jgi:hypothetical protein